MRTRALVSFAVAAAVTVVLVLWRGDPDAPVWTALVAGMGAGFLATVAVLLAAPAIEAAAMPAVLTVIGAILLFQGLPAWMAWPIITGPLTGWLLSRPTAPAPTTDG